MKFPLIAFALLPLTGVSLGAEAKNAQPAAPVPTSIYGQMDAASAKFKSAEADVRYDEYTKVVKDDALSTGSTYVERTGSTSSMGAVTTSQGAGRPDKILLYSGGTLQIYSPGTNQDDIYKAGANQARYESFLTLGFGGSSKNLTSQWTVQDKGPETIDGVKTEKLDLVGKDQSVRDLFSHVTLWIDPVRDVSLKQIFYEPNGNMRTTTYSNIRLNGKIDKRKYEIDKHANKVTH